VNYIAGVTSISFVNYCIALFAILPGTILYVFVGASAGSLADSASSGDNATITIIVIVVGAVFGIFAIVLTSIYAKRELNRVIAEREEAETSQGSDNEPDADGDIEAQVLDDPGQAKSKEEEVTEDDAVAAPP
jgi:preprotein translocase subunit SecG